jgi:hypothetical protein
LKVLTPVTATTAAPVSGQCVLSACIVGSVAYIASPIPCFIAVEVIKLLRAAFR